MPLESLLGLVEKLRERIDVHSDKLRQSEALTRYALIDPLLRELGWDTENPALVIPEYNVGGGRADYALLSDGKPVMMVEAKNLGTALQDGLDQGITYAMKQGTPYFSVTDGGRWEIYETHKPVPVAEKRIVQFDLKDGSAAEECVKTLALWRPNLDSARISPGQAPVVVPTPNRPAQPESPIPNPQPTPPSLEWQPLSELNQRPNDPRPVEIQFPDNSAISIDSWKSILVEVAKWLEKSKLLTEDHCPIKVPGEEWRTTKYIANTEAVHSNGEPFGDFIPVGPFYIARYSGRAVACAIQIIEHVGQDPAQFKVRFS